jgi:hypothetical protein
MANFCAPRRRRGGARAAARLAGTSRWSLYVFQPRSAPSFGHFRMSASEPPKPPRSVHQSPNSAAAFPRVPPRRPGVGKPLVSGVLRPAYARSSARRCRRAVVRRYAALGRVPLPRTKGCITTNRERGPTPHGAAKGIFQKCAATCFVCCALCAHLRGVGVDMRRRLTLAGRLRRRLLSPRFPFPSCSLFAGRGARHRRGRTLGAATWPRDTQTRRHAWTRVDAE